MSDDPSPLEATEVAATDGPALPEAPPARAPRQGHGLAPEALLAAVPTPAVVHRAGVVVTANAAGAALFGFERVEPMAGFHLFEALDEQALCDFTLRRHEEYAQCEPGANTPWARFALLRRDGRRVHVAFTCAQTEFRGEAAVLSFFVEESPDQVLDEALRHSTDVAILSTDAQGRVLWANPASEALSGYTTDEMRGRSPGAVLQCDRTDPSEVARLRRHVRAGSSVVSELLNRHKNGQEYWVRLHLLPSRNSQGTVLGYVGLQTDVTAEVRRRQSRQQEQDRLLSTFSHEARTPLNAILNLLDLLQQAHLAAPYDQWMAHARQASRALRDLVTGVLDAGRDAHLDHRHPVGPVRVQDVMAQALVVAQGYPRHEHVALGFHCPSDLPAVLLRGDRLLRVVLNLASNALKYTPKGRVDVRVERDDSNSRADQLLLRVSVTDTGIGIEPQDQARVLRPYETADQGPGRTPESTGLGLALCEQMLSSMGSTLRLYSAPGVGTCFSFELVCPVVPMSPAVGLPTPKAVARLDGLRALVIDDDPLSLMVMQAQLERLGAFASTHANAHEALAWLQAQGPTTVDVVLTDTQMPDLDGLPFTRLLRARAGFGSLPVVGVSGETGPAALEAARAAGMNDYVEKPVEMAHLAEVLAGLRAEQLRDPCRQPTAGSGLTSGAGPAPETA